MHRLLLLAPLLFVTACESGLARSLDVTVPTAGQFTATTPGVLVSDLSGTVQAYVVLCGQALKQPLTLSQDLGFGCLGERVGTAETLRAWVEPIAAPAAGLDCTTERSFFRALSTGPADAGGWTPAQNPDAAWAQGSVTANWRRDVSPCGGVLTAGVTLAVP